MVLPRYNEKIRWPLWLWVFFAFFLGSLSLAVWAAIGTPPAVWLSLVEVLMLVTFYFKSGLEIQVEEGWLIAGKAKIELKYIGEIFELDGASMRKVRGPEADPASFLEIRFWINGGVKIAINDPRDRTPYWLISTRHPKKLASAITQLN